MKTSLHHLLAAVCVLFSAGVFGQQSKQTLGVQLLNSAYEKHSNEIFEDEQLEHLIAPYAHDPLFKKVDVIVHGNSEFAEEAAAAGFQINSTIGAYFTLHIAPRDINQLSSLSSVHYVDLVPKPYKKLNTARTAVNADKAHTGSGLSTSYKGDGVVVGVIDYDFDLTHPAFYTADGSELRIKRVWMQGFSGNPPAGFTYGYEAATTADILAEEYTNNSATHGTHVAATAAGSANGLDDYEGIAPNADLVFVEGDNIADALNYIFNYAQSQSKPCVVNMSLGTHMGPHDGTSTLDKVIDQFASEGQIIVGAAGNEGEADLHIEHNFTGDTIITYPLLDNFTDGSTSIDIWGEKGKEFSVALAVYSYITQSIVYETDFIPTSVNDQDDTLLQIGQDQAYLSLGAVSSSPLNQKPHGTISYEITSDDIEVYLVLTSPSGKIHMWNNTDGSGGAFSDVDAAGDLLPGFKKGNTEYTVGEIGGTANEIIAVGAYTSKNSFTGLNSVVTSTSETNGDLAEFSSRGPTVDGRIKPNITAPGNYVVAAVNSFSADLMPGGNREDELVASTNVAGKTYYYGGMQGTSMATPVTSGVVALLLGLDPTLTPDRVKTILGENAIKDGFTGALPGTGTNDWGRGKIDAQASLLALESQVAAVKSSAEINAGISAYPNPVSKELKITTAQSITSVRVIDMTGKTLSALAPNNGNEVQVDMEFLENGIYLIEVATTAGTDVLRVVKR